MKNQIKILELKNENCSRRNPWQNTSKEELMNLKAGYLKIQLEQIKKTEQRETKKADRNFRTTLEAQIFELWHLQSVENGKYVKSLFKYITEHFATPEKDRRYIYPSTRWLRSPVRLNSTRSTQKHLIIKQ